MTAGKDARYIPCVGFYLGLLRLHMDARCCASTFWDSCSLLQQRQGWRPQPVPRFCEAFICEASTSEALMMIEHINVLGQEHGRLYNVFDAPYWQRKH